MFLCWSLYNPTPNVPSQSTLFFVKTVYPSSYPNLALNKTHFLLEILKGSFNVPRQYTTELLDASDLFPSFTFQALLLDIPPPKP